MATRLFVGKLSYNTTDETLEGLFAQYGKVNSARVIMDRELGRSKGFGFVEMEDDEAAQKAIKEVDGSEFESRTIAVSVARPREDRPRDDRPRGNGGAFRTNFDRR